MESGFIAKIAAFILEIVGFLNLQSAKKTLRSDPEELFVE